MKKSLKGLLGSFALLGTLFVSSCGAASNYAGAKAPMGLEYETGEFSQISQNNDVLIPGDHKIIYTVSYDLESEDIVDLQAKILSKVNQYDGYISSSRVSDEYANYSYKVPVDKLNSFLDYVDTFAGNGNKSISTEDITSSYEELVIQIETLESRKEVYENLLVSGTLSVSDTIMIYDKLDLLDQEIKYTKQYLERLKKEVAYSTVNVYYRKIEKNIFKRIFDFLFR